MGIGSGIDVTKNNQFWASVPTGGVVDPKLLEGELQENPLGTASQVQLDDGLGLSISQYQQRLEEKRRLSVAARRRRVRHEGKKQKIAPNSREGATAAQQAVFDTVGRNKRARATSRAVLQDVVLGIEDRSDRVPPELEPCPWSDDVGAVMN